MDFRTKTEENDTKEIVNSEYINWDCFKNSTILVTGATGMIGEQIVKSLLLANEEKDTNIKIVGLVRNKKKAQTKFQHNKNLKFIVQDVTEPIRYRGKVDYIIHTANSTSSRYFIEHPIETIHSIIHGTMNVLEFAKDKKIKSMVYLSSMEVYGIVPIDGKEPLKENDYGYLNILKTRSSYPESKRLAETLCTSYFAEYGVPVKIARLVQTIGASVDYKDNRVFAQFSRNVCEKQDIVLKTDGETTRNYCYITDAIAAIFILLERGINGESYNVANKAAKCSIKELAYKLSNKYKTSEVKFQLDDKLYPPATKLVVDTTKLEALNWSAKVGLEEMFDRLINTFSSRKSITESNKSVKLLICYHKKDKLFKNDVVLPIHCGREVALEKSKDGQITKDEFDWLMDNTIGDNTGDNISSLNRDVNELTAIYWAWKNYDKIGNPDYIGLMHYRRLFNLSKMYSCTPVGTTLQMLGLNKRYLNKLMTDYDVITKSQITMDKQPFGYELFQKFINLSEENHPILYRQYLKAVNKDRMHTSSMFIMKREDFFNMCEEIIPLVLELLKHDRQKDSQIVIDGLKENYPKEMQEYTLDYAVKDGDIPRLYGFVSEYMIGLYLMYLEDKYGDRAMDLPTYRNPSFKNNLKLISRNLFSLTNGMNGQYKIIKLLGFTIKMKRNKKK